MICEKFILLLPATRFGVEDGLEMGHGLVVSAEEQR